MFVIEYKVKAHQTQYAAIEEAIRTTQFIGNEVLCYWQHNQGVTKYDLNKQCKPLAQEFEWVGKLNSMARQLAAERPWLAISWFYDNCKKQKLGKKGDPRYQNVGAQRHLGGRFPRCLRR